jgi:uncharacterized protein YdbL (DUF1318 family)
MNPPRRKDTIMRALTTIFCLAIIAFTLPATAQNLDQIRQQMRDRLDEVQALKAAKTVGEDANGYLHVLGDVDAAGKAVVEAENVDRKVVYTAIAAKTGSDPTAVGKARAKTIAESSAPGVMLQAPDGTWYEKK